MKEIFIFFSKIWWSFYFIFIFILIFYLFILFEILLNEKKEKSIKSIIYFFVGSIN